MRSECSSSRPAAATASSGQARRGPRGPQSSVSEMMKPQSGTATYRVCVYDGTANPQPRMELDVPQGGTCGTKPCWKANGPNGVGYANKAGTPNGVTALKFKGGFTG